MADPTPFVRPIRWDRLRTDEAERIIRKRVQDTGNVIISEHAFERIDERFSGPAFTTVDVYHILETGRIREAPIREATGEWKVIVVRRLPGTREAGVVTLIARTDDTLFVKTVEWMDWLT
ncbi:DUF4258 domain-containing protein [Acidisphaera sp. S103]|uniref:DUF4258 domain-containing protein n=1 Tax=Acidisphaera sp. S103 TaxID=1747223 RepID=UPI00131E56D3|nr:DUF4258 domain-containing protein [Acidisphaera sp. S103]